MDKLYEFKKRIDNLYAVHSNIKMIWDRMDSLRESLGTRHLFIFGDSGVGKTKLAREYVKKNKGGLLIDDEGVQREIMPVIFAEIPEPFTSKEFYETIISSLGAPHLPRGATTGEIKRQAIGLFRQHRVEMLILDQMDFIIEAKSMSINKCMDTIMHFSNQSGVSLVCMGQPQCRILLDSQFQVFRRFPRILLQRFEEDDDEFLNFLKLIEEQIKPPKYIGLGESTLEYHYFLHRMSKGIVGVLIPILQQAFTHLGVDRNSDIKYEDAILTLESIKVGYKNIILETNEEDFMDMINEQRNIYNRKKKKKV